MTTELDRIMRRMKEQGITISTTSHQGASFDPEPSPTAVIAESARKHGIYYEKGN